MSDPILELLASPPSPPLSVDKNAVYAGGRRRVRQRALRRTAFGVAGVVGAAAIAFAAIGPGLGGNALPAGPTPSTAASATSTVVFGGAYAVEVIPGAPADQPNVKFYTVREGQRTYLAGSSAEPSVVSVGTGSGADGVMLGTAPADAARFLTVTRGEHGGVEMDQQPLPGTDYQAVALKFERAQDVEKYQDTIWMNDKGDGVVRDGMGNVLTSTKLAERDTFFVDREDGVMGAFSPEGGWTKPLTSDATTTMGTGGQANGQWSWRSVTLLPPQATKIEFTWTGAEHHIDPIVEVLPNAEGVVAFADATAALTSSSGPRVTKVTWTDAAGTRHTESVD